MWILIALLASACFAITAYIDEYLTRNNPADHFKSIHARIGGIIITSTVSNIFGAAVLFLALGSVELAPEILIQALLTAIPMVLVLVVYLYLLDIYSVHFVVPLFQLTSLWLVLIGFWRGEPLTFLGIWGIILIVSGAYVLDTGSYRIRMPSKLVLIMLANTFFWALTLAWMTSLSATAGGMGAIIFWQCIGATLMGIVAYCIVPAYRTGLHTRITLQKKLFFWNTCANEFLSQLAYGAKYFALAFAPVAAYANAMSGLESILILALLFFFPIKKSSFTYLHVFAILIMLTGAVCIELSTVKL